MRRGSQSSLSSAEPSSPVDSLSLLPCSRDCGCEHFYGRERQDNLMSLMNQPPRQQVKLIQNEPIRPCRMPPASLRNPLRICKCEMPRVLYTFGRESQMQFGGSQGHLTKRRTESPTEPPGEGLAEHSAVIWILYDKYGVVFGRYMFSPPERLWDHAGHWVNWITDTTLFLFFSFLSSFLSPLFLFLFQFSLNNDLGQHCLFKGGLFNCNLIFFYPLGPWI